MVAIRSNCDSNGRSIINSNRPLIVNCNNTIFYYKRPALAAAVAADTRRRWVSDCNVLMVLLLPPMSSVTREDGVAHEMLRKLPANWVGTTLDARADGCDDDDSSCSWSLRYSGYRMVTYPVYPPLPKSNRPTNHCNNPPCPMDNPPMRNKKMALPMGLYKTPKLSLIICDRTGVCISKQHKSPEKKIRYPPKTILAGFNKLPRIKEGISNRSARVHDAKLRTRMRQINSGNAVPAPILELEIPRLGFKEASPFVSYFPGSMVCCNNFQGDDDEEDDTEPYSSRVTTEGTWSGFDSTVLVLALDLPLPKNLNGLFGSILGGVNVGTSLLLSLRPVGASSSSSSSNQFRLRVSCWYESKFVSSWNAGGSYNSSVVCVSFCSLFRRNHCFFSLGGSIMVVLFLGELFGLLWSFQRGPVGVGGFTGGMGAVGWAEIVRETGIEESSKARRSNNSSVVIPWERDDSIDMSSACCVADVFFFFGNIPIFLTTKPDFLLFPHVFIIPNLNI